MKTVSEVNNNKRLKTARYISGFDGIRALAVLGVIIYHLMPYQLKGGYLGVPIFFVVSGYLITDLLIQEWNQNGKIDLMAFYYRRLKRLYPALVAMLVGTGAYITLFQRSLLVNIKQIIFTNLLYVYNWWEVGHGQSYFDRFNGESPFTHLWSLSIEGQYYLIWPILLMAMLILIKHKGTIVKIMLTLTGISALLMGFLYQGADSLNRVYYGTDTRMFAIVIGALLAIVWPSAILKTNINSQSKATLNIVGLVSILGIGWLFFTLSGQATIAYRGGMLLVTILSAMLVAACAHPGASVNSWLTNPVFKWIGTRSYGIYLYQFPVMIFYETKVTNIADHPLMNALIEVSLIAIISELSYRYLETPMRRYDYRNIGSFFTEFVSSKSRFGNRRYWAIPITAVVAICVFGMVTAPKKAAPTKLQQEIASNQKLNEKRNQAALEKQKQAKVKPVTKMRKLTKAEYLVAKKYSLNKREYLLVKNTPLTAIGDSVLADGSNDLREIFKRSYISAAVGRQIWQAGDVIKRLKQKNQLASNVLINLGTNSPVTAKQVQSVINEVGKSRQVFWVNVHVPTRNWESEVNRTLAAVAKKQPNMHIINWYHYSLNNKAWFWDDNVHPNNDGNIKYAGFIAKEVAKQVAKQAG